MLLLTLRHSGWGWQGGINVPLIMCLIRFHGAGNAQALQDLAGDPPRWGVLSLAGAGLPQLPGQCPGQPAGTSQSCTAPGKLLERGLEADYKESLAPWPL